MNGLVECVYVAMWIVTKMFIHKNPKMPFATIETAHAYSHACCSFGRSLCWQTLCSFLFSFRLCFVNITNKIKKIDYNEEMINTEMWEVTQTQTLTTHISNACRWWTSFSIFIPDRFFHSFCIEHHVIIAIDKMNYWNHCHISSSFCFFMYLLPRGIASYSLSHTFFLLYNTNCNHFGSLWPSSIFR